MQKSLAQIPEPRHDGTDTALRTIGGDTLFFKVFTVDGLIDYSNQGLMAPRRRYEFNSDLGAEIVKLSPAASILLCAPYSDENAPYVTIEGSKMIQHSPAPYGRWSISHVFVFDYSRSTIKAALSKCECPISPDIVVALRSEHPDLLGFDSGYLHIVENRLGREQADLDRLLALRTAEEIVRDYLTRN